MNPKWNSFLSGTKNWQKSEPHNKRKFEIHETGRVKRAESEKELESLEQELKDKLLEINVKGK